MNLTTIAFDYENETTLLSPLDLELNVNAYIIDDRNLRQRTRYGEYEFNFQPWTHSDYLQLVDYGEQAKELIEQRKSPFSRKIAKALLERNGSCFVSQLFQPKEGFGNQNSYESLDGMNVDLKLHFRDDPQGFIYLQCSYIDLYEQEEKEPVEETICLIDF